MPNMSYCRFENTSMDLNDCLNALEKRNISSDSEKRKAKKLLVNICEFLIAEEIIEEYDQDKIDQIIEECNEEEEENY